MVSIFATTSKNFFQEIKKIVNTKASTKIVLSEKTITRHDFKQTCLFEVQHRVGHFLIKKIGLSLISFTNEIIYRAVQKTCPWFISTLIKL